jgi:hypothetical protein
MTRSRPGPTDPTSGAAGSPEYLAQHIRNGRATDRRVLELGLEVTVGSEAIVLFHVAEAVELFTPK